MKTFWAFLLLIGLLFVACLFTGCAKMGTRQVDKNTTIRYELDETGKTNSVTSEIRETSTSATGTALGAGQAVLKGFEAKQDGGLQGLKIKESSQQTDGLMQAVQVFKSMSDIMRMVNGIPPSREANQVLPAEPEDAPLRSQAPRRKKRTLVPEGETSQP